MNFDRLDFLELRKGAERSGFWFARAAARDGDKSEGGKADRSNDAEHGRESKGVLRIAREK